MKQRQTRDFNASAVNFIYITSLNQRYLALKGEGKEAEQIRKSVYSILRQERHPRKAQDMER